MPSPKLTADLTVEQLFKLWPSTIVVFRELAFACLGCDFSPFCNLADVAEEFDIALDELLAILEKNIADNTTT
ncbi:MAG: disulfide oxidoreductase [Anaerolineae bacterium]